MTRCKGFPVVGAAVTALLVVAASAEGGTWYDYGGHSYALTNVTGSWDQAETEAVQAGGFLATVNDANENAWLYTTFHPLTGDAYEVAWIGFYDLSRNDGGGPTSNHASNFIWASGAAVTYTNWGPNQPDNSGGSEYWCMLSTYGAAVWNDFSPVSGGYRTGGYQGIIEVVPEPASLALLGVGAAALVLRRSRRSLGQRS